MPGRSWTSALRVPERRLKRARLADVRAADEGDARTRAGRPEPWASPLTAASAAARRPGTSAPGRPARARSVSARPVRRPPRRLPLEDGRPASERAAEAPARRKSRRRLSKSARVELDAEVVAEAVDPAGGGADEPVLDVLVAIVVVAEGLHREEAVGVDLLERDEEAEGDDGRDVRVELLPTFFERKTNFFHDCASRSADSARRSLSEQ